MYLTIKLMEQGKKYVFSTRTSALAMWQTNHIKALFLAKNPEVTEDQIEFLDVNIAHGDVDQSTPLH